MSYLLVESKKTKSQRFISHGENQTCKIDLTCKKFSLLVNDHLRNRAMQIGVEGEF